MLYSKQVILSSGGTEATSTKVNFKVNKGVIYRAWLIFPPGCAGLVKVRVYHEVHPIMPVNISDYIAADDYVFEIPLFFEIEDEPYLITFEGWNEDDTYNHTISLLLLIVDKKWIVPAGATEGLMEGLKTLVLRR
jgi:hypothetical protein